MDELNEVEHGALQTGIQKTGRTGLTTSERSERMARIQAKDSGPVLAARGGVRRALRVFMPTYR